MDGKDRVILVVDDQPANLKVLLSLLQEHDFTVRVAENGAWALDVLNTFQPDIILLDVMMPEMNGLETCRRIKANKATADIPVIFMTALDSIEDRLAGFEAGGVDYISKPFQQTEVLARVNTHVELSKIKQNLENQVQERTASLQESNTALKVLLEHRSSERENFEQKIISRIHSLIKPYLKRLQETDLDGRQKSLVEVVESNLEEITADFSDTLYSRTLGLTRREMEIAALIKTGKTNLEIGSLLNISERAVSFHRQNLREKLGLLGKKVNLVAYLNETTLK